MFGQRLAEPWNIQQTEPTTANQCRTALGRWTVSVAGVASFRPGHATRLDPESCTPCALVGKALEALEDGEGIIEVLLMR